MSLSSDNDMLRRIWRPMVTATLVLVAVSSAAAAHAQTTGACITDPEAKVPSFVLSAAISGTFADTASAFAEAGVCAGFVVSDKLAGDVTRAWRDEPREPLVPLAEAIEAMKHRHAALVIQRGPCAWQIHDTQVDLKQPSLTKTLSRIELNGVRAGEALRRVVDQAAPGSAPAGGQVGSYMSRPGESSPSRDDLEGPVVTVTLANATLLEALREIGGKSPGIVWLLKVGLAPNSRAGSCQLMIVMRRGTQRLIGTPFR